MSKIGIVIICGVIGALIGLFMATGAINQTKKSERGAFSPIALVAGLAIGALGGLFLANTLIQDDNAVKKFGFDKMETFETKSGRKWVVETKWVNPLTGNTNSIETRFSEAHRSVIIFLNSNLQIDHESTSDAKDFIYKVHLNTRYELIKKIKAGELEII
jgi:hypothetical protein